MNGDDRTIEITLYDGDIRKILLTQGLQINDQTIYFRQYNDAYLTLFNVPIEASNRHILELVEHIGCKPAISTPEMTINRLFDIEDGFESLNGIVELPVNTPPNRTPDGSTFFRWFDGRVIPYAYNKNWRGTGQKTTQPRPMLPTPAAGEGSAWNHQQRPSDLDANSQTTLQQRTQDFSAKTLYTGV